MHTKADMKKLWGSVMHHSQKMSPHVFNEAGDKMWVIRLQCKLDIQGQREEAVE